jgi:uncharacterized delta-60 repeat protein
LNFSLVAQAGAIDTTFGRRGSVIMPGVSYREIAYGVAVDGTDRIVAVGESFASATKTDFYIVRYTENGILDTSFGGDGIVRTDFAGSDDYARAVAIDHDGKIVVAGYTMAFNHNTNYDFAMARYNGDGSLDTSFDSDGKLTTDFISDVNSGEVFSHDMAFAIALSGASHIVVAGAHWSENIDFQVCAVRYESDGSLDTGFDADGKACTNFIPGSSHEYGYALNVDDDRRVLVAGYTEDSAGTQEFAMARWNADGMPDTSFGSGGQVMTDLKGDGLNDKAYGVAVLSSGNIVLGGTTKNSAREDTFAIAVYDSNGVLNTSYGTSGAIETDISNPGWDTAYGMTLTPDEKIVLVGYSDTTGSDKDLTLVKYDPEDFPPDTEFDGDGIAVTDLNSRYDHGYAVTTDSYGRIIVAGSTQETAYSKHQFLLSRYNPSNAEVACFDAYDNDLDGLTDCFDADCSSRSECVDAASESQSCSDHTDCDLSLSADTVQHEGFETYAYHSETAHFVFFMDSESAETPLIASADLDIGKDALECAYKYYVCEKDWSSPNTEKTHIYIGDVNSATDSTDHHITLTDALFMTTNNPDMDMKTLAHEFFHLVQQPYYTSSDENIKEAPAVLGEQLISRSIYDDSIETRELYLESLHQTFTSSYDKNLFFRFVFEQLGGISHDRVTMDPWDISRNRATYYLKELSEYLYADSSSHIISDIVTALDEFIPVYATDDSLARTLTDMEMNFITAQYAYYYADPELDPKYTFLIADDLATYYSMAFYSENNAISLGNVTNFTNANTSYDTPLGTYDPYGFWGYLNGEYHELDLDAGVTQLRFTDISVDEYIKAQLILRYADGDIVMKPLFDGTSTDTIEIPLPSELTEVVFVAFTTRYNPLSTSEGRTYEISVEGL